MSSLMKLAFNALSKTEYCEISQNKSYITYDIVYEMGNEQRKKNVEKMKIWANSIVNIKKTINGSELKIIMDLMDKFISLDNNFLVQSYNWNTFDAWSIFIRMLDSLFIIKTYIHRDDLEDTADFEEKYFPFNIWTKENWLIYRTFHAVYDERISNKEYLHMCYIPQYIQNAKKSILYPFLIYKHIDATMSLYDLKADGYVY